MSATEELRRLLDELRKLACDINENEIRSHSVITLNQGRYKGRRCRVSDWRQGLIPCKPWNSVRPERNECKRCGREKCVKRDRLREYQRLGWWV